MLRIFRTTGVLLALLFTCSTGVLAQANTTRGTRHFLYLSDQRVITLEVISIHKIILNYINLGQTYELLEAPQIALKDESGGVWRGHVIAVEPVTDPSAPYVVSRLIEPRKFEGLSVLGDFAMEAPCAAAYLKTGGRIMELEGMSRTDFDKAAELIQSLDLGMEDSKLALQMAGFRRGFGKIFFEGSSEAAALDDLFPDVDPRPPVAMERPAPLLPSAFSSLPDPVVVELRLLVGQAGGLYQFRVLKAPDPALGARAIDTVKNSWQFLPAISKGKVTDAELTLRVVFRR